ncbi:aminotransferase class I/II-fold pyridoxal phosphate-dependent enzyme [Candidatus Clostridium radicumherbarum]|uniref:Aminotransferase class I/II-fold pyridoxal phosphate-dependent enzyme n=1 Tax=Candidatus Clostridium radicumherbarum TaxID=3381662 RepID=A0ABW8TWQ8_9CLOT
MSKLPLIEGVLRYVRENNVSFSMPGHKGGEGFLGIPEVEEFFKDIIKADLTEVDGLDNLHNPEGIIKESLDKLSKFYKSRKSYFLVNGSTSGNLAMIFSCFDEGDKIIVERNCHRSIFNGIVLRKLRPVYIRNELIKKYNAPMSIDVEHFLCLINNNKDAKGIILTYPNYYGICTDLQLIVNEAKKYNMKVLVDSAHGAHFGICEELPESALTIGADMVVMSSHKTLPSFTQTAFLHVGKDSEINIVKVDFYVSTFLSTSPSYMLMCSMDYGRYFLEEYGKEAYKDLIKRANKYRGLINKLNWVHVLEEKDIINEARCKPNYHILDLSRFVINVYEGLSAHKLYNYLRKNKIQAEMSDGSNVILIFSPFNYEEDFKRLYEVLSNCNKDEIREHVVRVREIYIPKAKLLPYEASEKKRVELSIDKALGKICALSVVPYPPGVPILNPGEIIDYNCISVIKYYLENGVSILGINDNKITVIDS